MAINLYQLFPAAVVVGGALLAYKNNNEYFDARGKITKKHNTEGGASAEKYISEEIDALPIYRFLLNIGQKTAARRYRKGKLNRYLETPIQPSIEI